MGDVVCLSSGDEMELEDIVEVYEEPLEDPQVGLSLIPEPSILQGLVSPEDLGLTELNRSIHTTSSKTHTNQTIVENTEKSSDDHIINRSQHINKKQKIKCPAFNQEPKINAEPEMRISISKRNNGSLGQSTQVKIVIPSTSSTSSNSNYGNVSGPSSSSTFMDKINEYRTNNTECKGTARKSISSFTPRVQIPMLPKPRFWGNDVVTLDSDDEEDNHISDHLQQSKLRFSDSVHTQNSLDLDDTIPCLQDSESNDTKNNSNKTDCVASQSTGKKSFDTEDHVQDTSQSLDFYIGLFESEWMKHLTSSECEKVKKKLDKRFAAISNQYKPSKVLREFLLLKTKCITKEPRKVFPVIKEVLDELTKYGQKDSLPVSKLNEGPVAKKRLKLTTCLDAQNELDDSLSGMTAKDLPKYYIQNEDSDSASKESFTVEQLLKRKRHINKLERALKACGKEIKRCEEEELSLSDMEDENSGYLRVSRYKARYMKIYRKIAQLRKLDSSLQRKQDKKFKTEASRIPEINSRIETLVNKNKSFPDYADVLKLYEKHYQENSLNIEKELMKQEAQDTFVAMGKTLKARRKFDEMDVMQSYIPIENHDDDPADKDTNLKNALEASLKLGEENMSKVMNEFVIRQVTNNEQPEEVPDNEVENETNVEDDDSEEQCHTRNDNNERDSETSSSSNSEPEPKSNEIIENCIAKTPQKTFAEHHFAENVKAGIDNLVEVQSDKIIGKRKE